MKELKESARGKRNQDSRFPNPESRFAQTAPKTAQMRSSPVFLKKTGQVLKKTSSVFKETGVVRWDQNDLPVGPQSVSGGIGKSFRWDRKAFPVGPQRRRDKEKRRRPSVSLPPLVRGLFYLNTEPQRHREKSKKLFLVLQGSVFKI